MSRTRVLTVDPLDPAVDDIRVAADVLGKGGLVIIPTDTVYGVACDMMNHHAIERLCRIKERPKDKPFAMLVAHKESVEDFAYDISANAYKLMHAFWPGPLTLVFKSKEFGSIGMRMPDHRLALRIISMAQGPLACPSANLPGQVAPSTFADALADLDGLVDLAIDAGSTKVGIESTVVDVSSTGARVVREGAIKISEIERAVQKKYVLFVCTGNSCRSVMAQALLKKKLKELNRPDVEVSSAGIMMMAGLGASDATRELLRKEGIDVSLHRSTRVTRDSILQSDLVLVMERIHEQKVLQIAPEAKNRVFLLKEFAKIGGDHLEIEDPVGTSAEFYEKIYAVIKEAVARVAELI